MTRLVKMICALALAICSIQVKAEIVVVTSKNSPINTITQAEAKNIFLKKVDNIGGNKLNPIDLPQESSTRTDFYERVTNKSLDQVLSYWARQIFTGKGSPPEVANSIEQLSFRLSRDPSLIGYALKDEVTDDILDLQQF